MTTTTQHTPGHIWCPICEPRKVAALRTAAPALLEAAQEALDGLVLDQTPWGTKMRMQLATAIAQAQGKE